MRSTARRAGARDGRVDRHLVLHRLQRVPDLRQGDLLHVRAEIAGPHELDVGMLDGDVVAHRALGHQHDAPRLLLADIVDHRRGRAGEVGHGHDLGRAFGVGEDNDARMAGAELLDVGGGEALVHLAVARPGDDLDAGFGGDVLRQVLVRQHDDLRHTETLDDLPRIAGGAADVALGLHRGRGVHIGDDGNAGIALAQQADIGGGDRGGERAAGVEVGDQHALGRIEELRRLGHEVDAGEHDHLGVDFHRLAGQRQAVADDVGHAMEDLRRLVVVRQDDGIPSRASARVMASISPAKAGHSIDGITDFTRS